MAPALFHSLMELGAREVEQHRRGESIGLTLDALAGLGSTIAAAIVLVLIFLRKRKDGWSSWEALDISVTALFFAEFIQGIGHIMDLKWVIAAKSYTSTYCTAQGAMQQLGETAVAFVTMTIAVQTFLTIWWLKRVSVKVSLAFILLEFLFVILFVGIGFGVHTHPPKEYYGAPTPYWCWIDERFQGEQIAGEYVWFWLALGVSLVLYIPLSLMQFGHIKSGKSWWRPTDDTSLSYPSQEGAGQGGGPSQHLEPGSSSTRQHASVIGHPPRVVASEPTALSRGDLRLWSTILYPTLYCILVMPVSVVRWVGFREAAAGKVHHRPVATFIVAIIFTLSGILNAFLYLLTRATLFRSNERGEPIAPPIRAIVRTDDASNISTVETEKAR